MPALSPRFRCLSLQSGDDRGAIGGIFRRLLVVDADNIAYPAQGHRLGAVFDVPATLFHDQRHERRSIVEHDIAYQLVGPLAHAKNVKQATCLQCGNGLGADHATVGDDADAADREAFAQPVDHRHQGSDIGGVARPHLRADRTTVAVDQHREDHLP